MALEDLTILKYLIVPWIAILWRIGGRGGFPKARYIRKLGVPISLAIFAYFHGVAWYWGATYIVAFFLLGSLPNTLIGDSFWGAPWWLFIKGFLDGSAIILLGLKLWHFSLIMAAIFGSYMFFIWLFSNLAFSAKYIRHEKVELATGGLYATLVFMVVT